MPRCFQAIAVSDAAARRALDETLLDHIGLDNVLDRVARLGEAGGDGFDADRAAAEIDGDHVEVALVELVEAHVVDQRAASAPRRRSRE